MANLTNGYENELLDGLCSVTQLTTPATVYLALFTADPTETGDVTSELSGGGYARTSIASKFSAASGTDGTSSNTAEIAFPTATADWDEVTHVGWMKSDVETTADMMVYAPLDTPITITNGQVFKFSAGTLTMIAS